MKTLVAIGLFLFAAAAFAQTGTPQNAFTPDQVKFGPAPPFLPVGAELAVLEGNPMGAPATSPFA